MLEQKEVGHQYQKWICKLMSHDFEIHYKKGITNIAADALSRKTEDGVELCSMSSTNVFCLTDLYAEIANNPFVQQLKSQVQQGDKPLPGFSVRHDRLYFHDRLVIPNTSPYVIKLLHEYHNSSIGGHSGDLKTYQRLAREWYWKGMRKDVKTYV